MMEGKRREVRRLPHHEQLNLCTTRPAYRQGRQLTAVKVYTVNDESQHLIITGVPSLGLQDDLRKLCGRFGDVKSLIYVPNHATEQFVESYHIQYARIQSARFAKRQIDGRAFFGGSLHVCYAPEMESISETRNKLIQRRRDVAKRCISNDSSVPTTSKFRRFRNHSGAQGNMDHAMNSSSLTNCIWNGQETKHDPRVLAPAEILEKVSSDVYGPLPCAPDWRDVGVKEVSWTSLPSKQSSASSKIAHVRQALPLVLPSQQTKSISTSTPSHLKVVQSTFNSKSVPSILKLVPSQVKGVQKKIVFHPKKCAPLNETTGIQSLDATIQSVREKIRAVGVPNVKILLEKKGEGHLTKFK
ncbi:uncharacterized protein LOC117653789 isoform X2 [Thrips palmi]|uniref:RNA-binding protein 48 n=1 Tax=Thrips palmi TaxID=161013 RepID=A0A6P9ABT0_THRPL|nr:uncharacterized protein LOC117653789 isoform X2 [Thrips palmi]